MDKIPRLQLVNSITGFKSANLVGTASDSGTTNLAIFNSVVHIGSNPPLMGFILRPLTVPRHTYRNIQETGWFTINHIHPGIYRQAHNTSGNYREDISEFEVSGLTPYYSDKCKAPYVKESRINIGLTFEEEHEITANGTLLIVGAIQEIFIPRNSMNADGFVDIESAGSVTISGIDTYHKTKRIGREEYVRVPKDRSRDG